VRATTSTTVAARVAVPTVSLSGVVVSSLSADAVSSTSVRLSWQLVQLQRTVVEGFRVRYRPLRNHDDRPVDYLLKTVRPGDVTQFLLTGWPQSPAVCSARLLFCCFSSPTRVGDGNVFCLSVCGPAHVVQWSNHLGAMCSRA